MPDKRCRHCDDTTWIEAPMLGFGSCHNVSQDGDVPPTIYVPDGRGGFKEHECHKPKPRLGFRHG